MAELAPENKLLEVIEDEEFNSTLKISVRFFYMLVRSQWHHVLHDCYRKGVTTAVLCLVGIPQEFIEHAVCSVAGVPKRTDHRWTPAHRRWILCSVVTTGGSSTLL